MSDQFTMPLPASTSEELIKSPNILCPFCKSSTAFQHAVIIKRIRTPIVGEYLMAPIDTLVCMGCSKQVFMLIGNEIIPIEPKLKADDGGSSLLKS